MNFLNKHPDGSVHRYLYVQMVLSIDIFISPFNFRPIKFVNLKTQIVVPSTRVQPKYFQRNCLAPARRSTIDPEKIWGIWASGWWVLRLSEIVPFFYQFFFCCRNCYAWHRQLAIYWIGFGQVQVAGIKLKRARLEESRDGAVAALSPIIC